MRMLLLTALETSLVQLSSLDLCLCPRLGYRYPGNCEDQLEGHMMYILKTRQELDLANCSSWYPCISSNETH